MAKGGVSEAAAEPGPKQTQTRTPTRRMLDMIAMGDAGAREDAAATCETGEALDGASLAGGKDVFDADPDEETFETFETGSARASRERVWRALLGDVTRAVDRVYVLCETECGAPEIEATASLLEARAADLKALPARAGDRERSLARREGTEKTSRASAGETCGASISWDVGRVAARGGDASRDAIRAAVDADAAAGGWRPARGRRGERRRERDAGDAPSRPRRARAARRDREDRNAMCDLDASVAKVTRTRMATHLTRTTQATCATRTDGEKTAPPKTDGVSPDARFGASRPPRSAGTPDDASAETPQTSRAARPADRTTNASAKRAASLTAAASVRSSSGSELPGGSLAVSGASASSFGSFGSFGSRAGGDEDGASASPPVVDERSSRETRADDPTSGRSASPARAGVWNAKRDWGAILAKTSFSAESRPRAAEGRLASIASDAAGAAMHAKLMSPDRKKKTPGETAASLLERQARATEARARAESDRASRASRLRGGGDPARARPTAAEKEVFEARAAERKTRELEARLLRAEETREARIDAVVKKASEETRKVEEIALLHALEAANKKAALRERLADAEKRRASVAEARRVSAEAAESAARAAEARRVAEETRKRLRVAERVREKEARRDALARTFAAREAALTERRDEAAAEKRADREARERRLKREADERRDETRRRLLAADARRREYLNLVREGAVGSSTPGRAERDAPERGKSEKTHERTREKSAASTSPSSPSRLHAVGASSAAPESPSRPSRAAAGEALPGDFGADAASRHRAMRKRAKKLRQRLAAAAGTVVWRRASDPEPPSTARDDATGGPRRFASWSAVPEHAGAAAASPRLRRLAAAVARRDAETCLNAHREVRVALAEAGAAAAAAGAEEHGTARGLAPGAAAAAAALAGAVTCGLVRAVAEALAERLAASAQGGGFLASPEAAVTCVSLAVALDVATAGSPLAAESLLAENLAAPLIPHLVAGLGLVGDPAAMEAATPGAGGGVPPPTAALEPLLAVITRAARGAGAAAGGGSGGDARRARLEDDFAQLLVASGAVDALASLFALCDRPKEQSVEPVPPAIVAGLRLLESLLESEFSRRGETPTPTPPTRPTDDPRARDADDGRSSLSSLFVALRETALAGLPSLLTYVLLQTQNETRAPVLADPRVSASRLPANFVPVATAVLRLLNAIHRAFGPVAVQQALSSSDLRVETHHLLSVSLAICCGEWDRAAPGGAVGEGARHARDDARSEDESRWTLDALAELLDETVLFIGAFALLCPANQDMLRWGRPPTLAQRLPDLPFEYYADAKKKAALFPTLVAVAFRHPTNRAAIARDLSLETVRAFVEAEISAAKTARDAAARPPTDDVGGDDASRRGGCAAAAAGLPARFDFAARFPPELWEDAARDFASHDAPDACA